MRVLITGVAGLLGSRLADWILANHPQVEVIGIDDLSGGFRQNIDERVAFYKLDAGSEKLWRIFAHHGQIDVVYHMAAYAAEGLSPFIRTFNYKNNTVVSANVINNCIKYGAKRLVFTSSMAVYGNGEPPFEEDDQMNPIDPYGVAKMACEFDIRIAGEQHGLDWCIIRPHNVIGAKQNIWDAYRNFVGIAIYKVLHDDPITIFGDGQQKRAFSPIDDILPCLWIAGTDDKASKQVINLGGTVEYTIDETAKIVLDVAGKGDLIYLPPRHEVKNAWSSYTKSIDILGYESKTHLRDGIQNMWNWALTQPDRERFVWSSYELDQGLYPYWDQKVLKNWENYDATEVRRKTPQHKGVLQLDKVIE